MELHVEDLRDNFGDWYTVYKLMDDGKVILITDNTASILRKLIDLNKVDLKVIRHD